MTQSMILHVSRFDLIANWAWPFDLFSRATWRIQACDVSLQCCWLAHLQYCVLGRGQFMIHSGARFSNDALPLALI